MNINKANVNSITWEKAFISKTLTVFHGVILVSIFLVIIFSNGAIK